jgi:hypothetical protein
MVPKLGDRADAVLYCGRETAKNRFHSKESRDVVIRAAAGVTVDKTCAGVAMIEIESACCRAAAPPG